MEYPLYHFKCGCHTAEFHKRAAGPVLCAKHKQSYTKKIIKCAVSPKQADCPEILELLPAQARTERCPKCKHEQKLQIARDHLKNGGTRIRNARLKSTKTKPEDKPINGRKCKRCGCNPWPNYYYCPPCHSIISNNDEGDTIFNEHTARPGMVDRALAW